MFAEFLNTENKNQPNVTVTGLLVDNHCHQEPPSALVIWQHALLVGCPSQAIKLAHQVCLLTWLYHPAKDSLSF